MTRAQSLETRKGRGPVAAVVFGGLWAAAGVFFLTVFLSVQWTQHG